MSAGIFQIRFVDGRVIQVQARDSVEAIRKAEAIRPSGAVESARYIGGSR